VQKRIASRRDSSLCPIEVLTREEVEKIVEEKLK